DPSSTDDTLKVKNRMFNLATGQTVLAPGYADNYPTPDAKYIISPERASVEGGTGLFIYSAADVLRLSTDPNFVPTPLFHDDQLPIWYPSVALLSDGPDKSIYRVLSYYGENLAVRDFEITHATKQVRALGNAVQLCTGQLLTIPMISKDGHEF